MFILSQCLVICVDMFSLKVKCAEFSVSVLFVAIKEKDPRKWGKNTVSKILFSCFAKCAFARMQTFPKSHSK